MGAQRVGGPEGWGPDVEKVRAPRVGVRRVGARRIGHRSAGLEGWGPEGGGPKISRFFFPLPLPFSLFFSLSLWGSYRGNLVVFEAPGPLNVHLPLSQKN